MDRSAGQPRAAVAAALPLVLRHHAVDVEAPRVGPEHGARANSDAAACPTCSRSRWCCHCSPLRWTSQPSTRSSPSPGPGNVVVWLGFLAMQLLAGAYAFRLDRESLRPLWSLPLQQFVYRQLMYLVVIQSSGQRPLRTPTPLAGHAADRRTGRRAGTGRASGDWTFMRACAHPTDATTRGDDLADATRTETVPRLGWQLRGSDRSAHSLRGGGQSSTRHSRGGRCG